MKIKVTSPHAAKAMDEKASGILYMTALKAIKTNRYWTGAKRTGVLLKYSRNSESLAGEKGLQGRKYFMAGEQWWWNA